LKRANSLRTPVIRSLPSGDRAPDCGRRVYKFWSSGIACLIEETVLKPTSLDCLLGGHYVGSGQANRR